MQSSEVYKYNPRETPRKELQGTFVARQAILDDILAELRVRARTPVNQHLLIIGPRGIGKTNLLLMIRYGILDDDALAKAYLPLQTAEEEYSIASLRDLFAKMLALILEQTSDEQLTSAAQTVSAIENDEHAAEAAIEAVREYATRSGRKILLLADNLDLILGDQLADKAQLGRLRDILMNESFLVLIGASPTYFEEVSGYERPFYNFFKTINLQDLTPEQMAEMLRRRAEWDGNRIILDRFEELKTRIKAVHHLTGGNPRLVLMLYQLCTASELPEVCVAVRALLDDVTPYYKSRLEQLPAQQRRVMDTFARLGRPATPTELAAETRLPINQVNSILKRLREHGFVNLAPQERRKKSYYMVSERVFRIWHQMRFSGASRRLQFLIEFIRIWYPLEEWAKETDRLLREYQRLATLKRYSEGARLIEHLGYMIEAAPTVDAACAVIDRTVRTCFESGDFERAEEVLEEARRRFELQGDRERLARAWFVTAYLRDAQGRTEDKLAALKEAVIARPDFYEALYNWGLTLARLADSKSGAEREALLQQATEKFQAAVTAKPNFYAALRIWGVVLSWLGDTKSGAERDALLQQAIEKFQAALALKPDSHEMLNEWGVALAYLAKSKSGTDRDNFLQQAIEKFQAALTVKPDLCEAFRNWGVALAELAQGKSGAEREDLLLHATEKHQAALNAKPDFHDALYHWGFTLAELAEDKRGAEYENLIERAARKVIKAIACASSSGETDASAFYSAFLFTMTLVRCGRAIAADDHVHARVLFAQALDRAPQAKQDLALRGMIIFLSRVVDESTVSLCAQFFEAMRTRGMELVLGVLEPIVKAVEYWQKGKDAEVLDRLNPEVREIVEQIIQRGAKPVDQEA